VGERDFVLLDVRQSDEVRNGRIPGAIHVVLPRLNEQIALVVPDKATKIIVYCERVKRSQRACATLGLLGYCAAYPLESGMAGWRRLGHPLEIVAEVEPPLLSQTRRERYSRHLRLSVFDERHQQTLAQSRVLLLGLGGLGSPAALYLAAAGVGHLGLLDADRVELSNLQRQVVHREATLGRPKVQSAAEAIHSLNSEVTTELFDVRLDASNIDSIMSRGWDVIVDGCDNFPTRYLINDASFFHSIPVVHGSVTDFEGRVTTFVPNGACYRCLFPEPPPVGLSASCDESGVLGVLPGIVGVAQATEVIKLLLKLGQPLIGRLLTYDALNMEFRTLRYARNDACALCGDTPTVTRTTDFSSSCTPAFHDKNATGAVLTTTGSKG
jgi:molybdopterin/thiamine biosynthesis adenylyltransferase/rhodanese-related sulfurtransferase